MNVRAVLSRLPVAAQVIVALFILGLGSHAVVFGLSVWDALRRAQQEAVIDLRGQLHLAQGLAGHLVDENHREEFTVLLKSLAILAHDDVALLVNADGRIMETSDAELAPRMLDAPWFRRLSLSNINSVMIQSWTDDHVYGVAPICEVVPGTISARRCVYLLVEHGTAWRLSAATFAELKRSAALLGVNVLFSLLCWWLINEAVAKPSQRIIKAISRFRGGDLEARCTLAGSDELAGISSAIDNAFETITAQQQDLQLLETAVSQSPAAIILIDAEGVARFRNTAHQRIHGSDELATTALLQDGRLRSEAWSGEYFDEKAGRWLRAVVSPIKDDAGQITHNLIITEDITDQKGYEAALLRKETVDDLTGLPNRDFARERLRQILGSGSMTAVIYLDIDGLTRVNETFGYESGNEVIKAVAQRLQELFPPPAMVGRLAGDEFLLVLPSLGIASEAEIQTARALRECSAPYSVAGSMITLTLRAGVAVFPRDGSDAASLIEDAYSAAIRARETGGGTYRLFNRTLDEQVKRRFELDNDLRQAVARDELRLFAQAYVSPADGVVRGAEVLVRWERNGALVPPGEFIPLAERNGAIVPISEWIVENAAKASSAMSDHLGFQAPISVNISAVEFRSTDLLSRLEGIRERYPGAALEIEVTEGVFAGDMKTAGAYLKAIDEMGFPLAIDDFGTGYSSLSYLRDFPFSKLKIDRSFIVDMVERPRHRDIVAATVALAHHLGLVVTAEGVEDQAQNDLLKTMGVDYIQGYLFHKPAPIEQFEDLIRRNRSEVTY